MRFFKRGPSEPAATGDFWAWWSGARDRIAAAIPGGGFDQRLVADISRAVEGIHRGMAWELGPGRTAQHAFCISPEGNAELRQAALRWLASAPPPDSTWEYYASKQAASSPSVMEVAGRRFDLKETRAIAAWDPARRRVDVRLWHPQFAGAPDNVKLQVAFVFLDNLLGEDDVERWVGEINLLDAPTGGRTPAELKAEIERHRTDPAGEETWVLGTLAAPNGTQTVVLADAGLKRIDHPFADQHVTIQVVLGADRMPTDAEATLLNHQEDDFLRPLGTIAVFAGRTTEPGTRTLHFVAEDGNLMRPVIDAWARDLPDHLSEGLPQLRLKVNFQRDMDWSFRRQWGLR